MTGAGGGALMTPMLILLFGVKPSTAISSDLVAAVLMRPIGAAVHLRKGTVNLRLVGWMVIGSVRWLSSALTCCICWATFRAAAARRDRPGCGAAGRGGRHGPPLHPGPRDGNQRIGAVHEIIVRPVPTVLIGMVGGLIVGMTSVGSGSLMIVLLLFLYPMLGARQLVGTDLTQAVPLTAAAALGALLFGYVEFGVTTSLDHRQRARRARRLVPLVAGARSLHPTGHHVRDLRVRPEVRRRRHDRARLDPLPGGPGRRGLLAGPGPAVAERRAERCPRRRSAVLHHSRRPAGCRSQRAEIGSRRQPAGPPAAEPGRGRGLAISTGRPPPARYSACACFSISLTGIARWPFRLTDAGIMRMVRQPVCGRSRRRGVTPAGLRCRR